MHRTIATAICALAALPAGAAALTGDTHPVSEPRYLAAVGALAREGDDEAHTCGATMIAPGWALTAAHCVDDRAPESFRPLGSRQRYMGGGVYLGCDGCPCELPVQLGHSR